MTTGMGIVAASTGTGLIVLLEDTPADGLPLAYRVLYHLVGLRELAPETAGQPVPEGRLWFAMTQPTYAPVPEGPYMDDFVRSIDPDGRRHVREAICHLERERYVVVHRPSEVDRDWILSPTESSLALMRKWQRRRLGYLEQHAQQLQQRLTTQPRGWRKWANDLLSPLPATALTALITVLVTVPVTIWVTHALGG
jgi:hypothetical protein